MSKGRAPRECSVCRGRKADLGGDPKRLDKKTHLWFWLHRSLTSDPREQAAAWVPAPGFHHLWRDGSRWALATADPGTLRAYLAHLQLPQCPAQLAEPPICQPDPKEA